VHPPSLLGLMRNAPTEAVKMTLVRSEIVGVVRLRVDTNFAVLEDLHDADFDGVDVERRLVEHARIWFRHETEDVRPCLETLVQAHVSRPDSDR